jgi:hypothetical protein
MTTPPNISGQLLTNHMATLRRIGPAWMRNDYLAQVARTDGPQVAAELARMDIEDRKRRESAERQGGI